jgi:hypothetical protein
VLGADVVVVQEACLLLGEHNHPARSIRESLEQRLSLTGEGLQYGPPSGDISVDDTHHGNHNEHATINTRTAAANRPPRVGSATPAGPDPEKQTGNALNRRY